MGQWNKVSIYLVNLSITTMIVSRFLDLGNPSTKSILTVCQD
jgi:hypothetical protein